LKAKDKQKYSAIIEIKASLDKTTEGLQQIFEKQYDTELKAEGYERILYLLLGVDGKRVEFGI